MGDRNRQSSRGILAALVRPDGRATDECGDKGNTRKGQATENDGDMRAYPTMGTSCDTSGSSTNTGNSAAPSGSNAGSSSTTCGSSTTKTTRYICEKPTNGTANPQEWGTIQEASTAGEDSRRPTDTPTASARYATRLARSAPRPPFGGGAGGCDHFC